jgi:hypothetical protein
MGGHTETERCDACGRVASTQRLRGCYYCSRCLAHVYEHITAEERGAAITPPKRRKRDIHV